MIAGVPIDSGPLDAGWVSLAALAGERFDLAEAYFVAAERGSPGLDRRGQGAYFVGTIVYYLAIALAEAALRGEPLPDVDAARFGLRVEGDDAMSMRYRIDDNAAPADRPVAEIAERAMRPLIERVKMETRLSEPAQWRLVADGLAAGFLHAGDVLGARERALTLGLAAVRDPRFKPFNGHTGYHLVGEHAFLRRGGCCRYYTCDGGSYCATCILRPPDEQLAELRKRMGVDA